MSSKKVINKNFKAIDNKIELEQTIKEVYSKDELENIVFNIKRQKQQLIEQNKKIIDQYNLLDVKEKETIEITQLLSDEAMQNI